MVQDHSAERKVCIMSPWLLNAGCSNEGGKNEDGKEGRELGLPGLLYADDLVLCGE